MKLIPKGKVDLTRLDLSGSGIVKLILAAVIIILIIAVAKYGAGKIQGVVGTAVGKATGTAGKQTPSGETRPSQKRRVI